MFKPFALVLACRPAQPFPSRPWRRKSATRSEGAAEEPDIAQTFSE